MCLNIGSQLKDKEGMMVRKPSPCRDKGVSLENPSPYSQIACPMEKRKRIWVEKANSWPGPLSLLSSTEPSSRHQYSEIFRQDGQNLVNGEAGEIAEKNIPV